jgi:dTDP-4-amino-4,6-dideoxygalactose transaminase
MVVFAKVKVEEPDMTSKPAKSQGPASVGGESIEQPVRDTYLIFGSPQILQSEIDEVVASLQTGWLGTGPKVAAFENKFRDYMGTQHALAVSSCTAALHLSMLAIELQPQDEVIVPSMTFAATANAVIHAGGKPVLVDVDRRTMCLDPEDMARRITSRTRAAIPVHFAGRACDMTAILGLAARHGLRIIEDRAHAVETLYRGRHAGTLGDLGAFSFYVTKNLVTGEGGMLTTANAAWAARIKTLLLHGLSADAWSRFSDEGFKHYEVIGPGFKYNMMDLQAALGLHQLDRVEANLKRRCQIWARYDQAFADLPVFMPIPEEQGTRHARHLYTLLLDLNRLRVGRDEIQATLHRQRIGTGIHYRALHLHQYYRETFGYAQGDFPNAEWISARTLSLPLSAKLTDQDIESIILAVRRTLQFFSK